MWKVFAQLRPPLSSHFLKKLTQKLVAKLTSTLPRRTPQEPRLGSQRVSKLWHPLSKIPLQRSGPALPYRRMVPTRIKNEYLIMEILRETRRTQMQIPLAVIESFFKILRNQEATVRISIWTREGLTQPIDRTVVISSGKQHTRLMRRLEMPQIKWLARPLAVLFVRLPGRQRYAYLLLPRNTQQYKIATRILRSKGQQGRGARRFFMGRHGDEVWREVSKILAGA